MAQFCRKIAQFFYLLVHNFFADSCMTRAAALAYTSLLSIVPLMTLSFTLVKAFPVFKTFETKLQDFIFANFVATSAATIQNYIQVFTKQTLQLPATSIIFLFCTAVLVIFNMETTFNQIWKAKHRRRGIPAFLMYWAVITLLPIMIGAGLALSADFVSMPLVSDITNYFDLKRLVLMLAPHALMVLAFALIYVTVPHRKVKLRYALFGGIIATILFEFAKLGFVFYIANFPTYELLYGALATLPIFLVWVYLSWLVILIGAEFARTVEILSQANRM